MYGVRRWSNLIFLHASVQFYQHHLLNRLSLHHCMFCLLCQVLIDHIGADLFLGSLFSSIDLYVCFYANTMLFCLLWLCRMHRWCVVELCTWNRYNFVNQCHPNTFNLKTVHKYYFSLLSVLQLSNVFLQMLAVIPLKCDYWRKQLPYLLVSVVGRGRSLTSVNNS